ncbi:MAG TPA: aldose epimerase family protein [Ignavibacteria bacterium]
MNKNHFGKFYNNEDVYLFSLKNNNGIEVKITNYGGIITSIITPDKNGNFSDIVLGFETLDEYLAGHPYFGAIIGRYCNRIKNGTFILNGIQYNLAKNDGDNHLHGGLKGFDKVLWDFNIRKDEEKELLEFSYLSKDMEEGYPGNLQVNVTYSLNNNNELKIEYIAKTDKDTIINLTNHSYFNLSDEETILNHELKIYANYFTPIDSSLIPTGELLSVNNTPFDFTDFELIGKRIDYDNEQLKYGNGYDHNFVLNKKDNSLTLAAELFSKVSGRFLQVFTTEPAIQFYSGNFLDGTIKGKNQKVYPRRGGLCLETQHYPDSPNKINFPSVILKSNHEYKQITIFKFGVK